ncbi:MAG TPA: NfeD family protein [Nocardioidaceae bacterium]|nr:NfeD family protein [Nocardioidaceae bacterium]
MQPWIVWLIIALGFGAAELLTATLDLALLSGAALLTAGAAAIGLGVGLQFVVFAVTAALMIGVVRPIARKHITHPPLMRSGTAALVGREATALTEVTKQSGRVRIGGEEWSARPYNPDVIIAEGETVDVLAIEGATALVHPREGPWLL